MRFQIVILKNAVSKRFMFLRFDLKSHLLSKKSQSQTHHKKKKEKKAFEGDSDHTHPVS
jgi:hypothetical protein